MTFTTAQKLALGGRFDAAAPPGPGTPATMPAVPAPGPGDRRRRG